MAAGHASEADVVIVGAGMAGLVAAVELSRAGRQVLLLESADRPGGRVSTDLVDGFRLDRGFQLINPSYPQLRRLDSLGVLDLDRLQLQGFQAGVRVALDDGHAVLADPRRSPKDLLAGLRAPLGSPLDKARFAAWALRCATLPPARLVTGPDQPYGDRLSQAGIDGPLRRSVIEPFLAGVLGEDAGQSSAHFVSLLIRAFVRATPAVPAWGMQALPAQLAGALPAGVLRTGVHVQALERDADATVRAVRTDGGSIGCRAVLIAADPASAARLAGLDVPELRSLTTFWFVADQAPYRRPLLHLDGTRRGPVVNAAVLSAAAPAYSPDGRALIASTMLGLPEGRDTERVVREQTGRMFGAPSQDWQLLRTDAIAGALPAMRPPLTIRQPVQLSETLFVAGDHRDTASLQGALASGSRAARAIRRQLAS
ncbi:MAG: NAD(P)/FAD-dependent oxidoreductase [Jatrophihabitans sp.]